MSRRVLALAALGVALAALLGFTTHRIARGTLALPAVRVEPSAPLARTVERPRAQPPRTTRTEGRADTQPPAPPPPPATARATQTETEGEAETETEDETESETNDDDDSGQGRGRNRGRGGDD